ncbi:MAG: adenine phosphoribosyltransferase [Candidatus Aminicenantes bacterium]|nr:adenine phosphoribosyltransferase [Candidatus Aminicenantes bacterium]
MQSIRERIREIKDFPKPGIGFKDITPVVLDAAAFKESVNALASWAATKQPQLIVGIESRGYLFAAPLAFTLGLGMALIRKKGKLPGRTVRVEAPNEYAVEIFEMHADAVAPGTRVVIIDDLIATGSSSISAVNLVEKLGGRVLGFGALVELSFLKGVEAVKRAHPRIDVFSLIRMES